MYDMVCYSVYTETDKECVMKKSKITSIRMTKDDYEWVMSEYDGVQNYVDAMLAMDNINKQRDDINHQLEKMRYALKQIKEITRGP